MFAAFGRSRWWTRRNRSDARSMTAQSRCNSTSLPPLIAHSSPVLPLKRTAAATEQFQIIPAMPGGALGVETNRRDHGHLARPCSLVTSPQMRPASSRVSKLTAARRPGSSSQYTKASAFPLAQGLHANRWSSFSRSLSLRYHPVPYSAVISTPCGERRLRR
jgi:hypothetical protein